MSEPVSTESAPQPVVDVASPAVESTPVVVAPVAEVAAVVETVQEQAQAAHDEHVEASTAQATAEVTAQAEAPTTTAPVPPANEPAVLEPTQLEKLTALYAGVRDFLNTDIRQTSDLTLAISNLNDSFTWAKAALERK